MSTARTIAPAWLSAIGNVGVPTRLRRARLRSRSLDTAMTALGVAGALVALAAIVAGATRLLAATPARRRLRYPFTGVPDRFNVAVSIFAHNGRAMAGVFGLLLIVQLALRNPAGPGPAQRIVRTVGELLLTGLIAANVLVVGASVGAYGSRMASALLPHGPVRARGVRDRARALPAGPPATPARPPAGDHRHRELAAARGRRRPRDLRPHMRPLRVLLILMLIAAGLGTSAVFISKAVQSLQIPRLIDTTAVGRPGKHRARAREHPQRAPAPRLAVARSTSDRLVAPIRPEQHGGGLLHLSGLKLVLLVALEIAGGVLLTGVLFAALVLRRVRGRSRRVYALYELHLSTHDEAKPQDLEDMVESIANVVHAFPAERVRNGQPFVALELICGSGQEGMEWSINLRCEPSAVRRTRCRDLRGVPRRAPRPPTRRGTPSRAPVRYASRAT